MAIFRTIVPAIAIVSALAVPAVVQAQTLVPGAPSLTMTFEIGGDEGEVVGTLTAPVNSASWQALPEGTKIDVVVTRSCYSLDESNVEVASFSGLAPGESVNFTDEAVPAWQYGYDYTYTPVASINGVKGSQGYGSIKPGIDFSFAYQSVTATSVDNPDGGFQVDISVLVPAKTNANKDIPVDMTAIEFYRVTNASTWPYETELIGTIDNPEKGKTYVYTDTHPTPNAENRYVVKCVSNFGYCETSTYTYVGFDVPSAPYPVVAEAVEGGNRISWTAPDSVENYGAIDPADTYYTVFRCWGPTASQREQIVTDLKETEYIDYGTDMEFPRAVRYEVQACNSVGQGGSSYSAYTYDLMVGPAESLPFVETFDGGADNLWTFGYSSYYCQFYEATEAEYSGHTVKPHSGSGLVYVDYAQSRGNASNDLTSYKINVEDATCLGLSFWYYAIPDNDITISVELSEDGAEYEELQKVAIADGVTTAEWRRVFLPLQATGARSVAVRFHVSAPTSTLAAILDDIMLLNYPSVGAIGVEYDSELCTADLTWENPSTEYAEVLSFEGFVDGVSVGEVESPWTFQAADYRTPYSIAVKAVYADIEAPLSLPVTVSVPRPPFTEFTIDEHVFSIVTNSLDVHEIIVKEYLGHTPLYSVPEFITFDGVSYSVIGIGTEAYKGNTDIVSVSMPENIMTIGENAFADCTSLRAVQFGKGLEDIKAGAFKGCSSLASVIFTSETVPAVAEDAFEGIKAGCKGKCPDGMAPEYAAVPGLSTIDFGVSGIAGILADPTVQVEYFDLQGRPAAAPAPGQVVIVRATAADGTVTTGSVVVK